MIGRQTELLEITRLLCQTRLLTLIGPGGCGKTSLALEAARSAACETARYLDGAWVVDLAQVQDALLVPQAIADALRVNSTERQVAEVVLEFLRPRSLLLVLDNCEHVIDAAARFAGSALREAPELTILATSQIPLNLMGETEWLVPSLALPAEGEEPADVSQWMGYAAIQLFVEHAAAVRAGFALSAENARPILTICRALDGIPLAIELAAARVKMLSVEEIAARLDQRLSLLVNKKRDVPRRHQTLSAALDWSYGLLASNEQQMLDRLSIFAAPWTMEAAAAVCAEDGAPVFELVERLVDRSMVVRVEGAGNMRGMEEFSNADQTRYRLLESIRLFGLSHLSNEEQAGLRDRMLAWFDHLTAAECAQLHGPRQLEVIPWVRADLPNLTAAVEWARSHLAGDPRQLRGLRIVAALSWAMRMVGRAATSVEWLEGLVAATGSLDNEDWLAARADAHASLSRQYWYLSAYNLGLNHAEAALKIYERLGNGDAGQRYRRGYLVAHQTYLINEGQIPLSQKLPLYLELLTDFQVVEDQRGVLETNIHIAQIYQLQNQFEAAAQYFQQTLRLSREGQNLQFNGLAAREYAHLLESVDRWPEAFSLLEEAWACFERLDFIFGLNYVLVDLGDAALMRGMLEQAKYYYRQSIAYANRSGTLMLHQYADCQLGVIALRQGNEQEAEALFRAAYFDFPGLENLDVTSYALRGIAVIRADADPVQAARLAGHADALHPLPYNEIKADAVLVLPRLAALMEALGAAEYTLASEQGVRMAVREILAGEGLPAAAAATEPPPGGDAGRKRTGPNMTARQAEKARFSGLTTREREVAVMIARGNSNRTIAQQLVIGERTVTTHVTHILEKLGYSSRSQIAAWAVEKDLVRVA